MLRHLSMSIAGNYCDMVYTRYICTFKLIQIVILVIFVKDIGIHNGMLLLVHTDLIKRQ